ncbi:hypothetical protein G7Y89_g870 [Cudoniella acicularis]|uniref:Uncharacterized protein n=1 Tax=Cudoniella acicularis TaxID=354080 RepID=A0A8H4RZ67_9HELO|nr:hypothetical protein G7Y89_g870 [Cudoniella acicularis]
MVSPPNPRLGPSAAYFAQETTNLISDAKQNFERKYIPDEAWQHIINDGQNFTNMLNGYRDVPPKELIPSMIMAEPMHMHYKNHIHADLQLARLFDLANTREAQQQSQHRKLISLYQSGNTLKMLNRFVDSRQRPLLEKVNVSGSGLTDDLRDEWLFQREWRKALHLPGLYLAGGNNPRIQGIVRLYMTARANLEIELNRISPNVHDRFRIAFNSQNAHLFTWLNSARENIKDVLLEMVAIAYAPRTQSLGARFVGREQPVLDEEALLQANMADIRVINKMEAKYEEMMQSHPFERLLVDLISRENAFEKALAVEHVEDKLIDKQVCLVDEPELQRTSGERGYLWLDGWLDDSFTVLNLERLVYSIFLKTNFINRQRRNFRLLREWSSYRPWLSQNVNTILHDFVPCRDS